MKKKTQTPIDRSKNLDYTMTTAAWTDKIHTIYKDYKINGRNESVSERIFLSKNYYVFVCSVKVRYRKRQRTSELILGFGYKYKVDLMYNNWLVLCLCLLCECGYFNTTLEVSGFTDNCGGITVQSIKVYVYMNKY